MAVSEIMENVVTPWREMRAQLNLDKANNNEGAVDQDAEDEDAEMSDLIEGMLTGYLETYADAEHYEVLAVEAQAARKLKFLSHDFVNIDDDLTLEREWLYGGAIDLIVRERATGDLWFMEHKTTVASDLTKYLHKLHWDPQIRGYAWIAQQPVVESDIEPMRLKGVIYNVARKKVPREPELLKSGKALSKSACDTTREVFMSAIIKHGLNPDDYADQLEKLKGKSFFARERYVFTDPELDAFAVDVREAAFRIMRAEQGENSTDHPRQVAVCQSPGAGVCPYSNICIEDGPMARKSFTVMNIRHAELKSDFAEEYVGKMRCKDNASVQQDKDSDPF